MRSPKGCGSLNVKYAPAREVKPASRIARRQDVFLKKAAQIFRCGESWSGAAEGGGHTLVHNSAYLCFA